MNALDFNDDQQLEQEFAAAVAAFPPPPGLKEAMQLRLLGEHIQDELPHTDARRRTRRRHRWIAWGIAASLLVAGWLVLNRSETKFVNVAYAEFVAALEKADQAEWVHYFEGNREEWISFRPFRLYSRSPQGILAFDRAANREYHYDRAANTLTVRAIGPPGEMEVLGFSEMMRRKVAHLEEQGRQVRKGTETFVGKSATVYEVTGYRANEGGKYVRGKYFFDTQTGRFLGFEGSGTGWLSWLKFWAVIDYPSEGPKDVYALGVPRDAKVIDETPRRDVVELVRRVDEARARGPRQLYQISVETYESYSRESAPNFGTWIEVTAVKDGRLRRDRYGVRRSADYEQSLQELASFRQDVVDRGIDAVEAWLKERKPRQILFADTTSGETPYYFRDGEGKLTHESIHSTLMAQALAQAWGQGPVTLGDLELDKSSTLVEDRQGPWGKLVGIENWRGPLKTAGWYVNPSRDYICEKHEGDSGDDIRGVTEVTEYERTPGGYWYAKAARKSVHSGRDITVIRNYRDDERAIDPNVFDESQIVASDLSVD